MKIGDTVTVPTNRHPGRREGEIVAIFQHRDETWLVVYIDPETYLTLMPAALVR